MMGAVTCNQLHEIDRAISAMWAIPCPESRDEWWRVLGSGIDAGIHEDELRTWSESGPGFNEADFRSTYRSLSRRPRTGQDGALFKTAREHGWKDDAPIRIPSPAEREQRRVEAEHQAAAIAAEEAQRHEAAIRKGRELLDDAKQAPQQHQYWQLKGVNLGKSVKRGPWPQRGWADALLIPAFDSEQRLSTIEAINVDGTKDSLAGGRKRGAIAPIKPFRTAEVVVIGEGGATTAVSAESCSAAGVTALGASNMPEAGRIVRGLNATAKIVFIADYDPSGTGLAYAKKAAAEVGGVVVDLSGMLPDPKFDAWDVARRLSLDDLGRAITRALAADPEAETKPAPEQPSMVDVSVVDAGDGPAQVTSENAIAFRPPSLIAADVRDGTERTRPLSETGNALRLLDMHGERLRFVPEAKAWLVWRDGAWQWDVDGAAVRATAADLPNRIYNEGATFDFIEAEHFAKWARKSQTVKVVDAAVRLLSDRGEVRLPLAVVDSDPMLAGLNNAREVIDLTTGKVRPAEPSDLVTKSLRVSEVGETAKASRWLQFLDQVFGCDKELIGWLQRWCGYLLTGSTREQIMLFCFGLGANGKSIFAETLRHLLGDYGRSVPVETLCESKRQAGGATPDLADLIGCRLAMSSETEDGQALAESLVKSLVAGDTISARPLYGRPVQFSPAFKLLMLGNHRPVIRGTDNGIWRRIRLVPFSRTFGPDERDPALLDKLKAEAPHILAWMLEGCLQWQRRGLADVPTVVSAQTKDYREEQDLVGQWLAERVNSGSAASGCQCPSKLLYQDYCEWAEANGLRPCSAIALGRRLRERGFVSERKAGGPEFQGIALKPKH